MTLPNELALNDPEKLVPDLQDMYRDLKEAIEGFTLEFEGKIYGSTVEGVGTYSANKCYYVRRGDTVDLFCQLSWTGHTGSGDLRVEFPFYEKQFAGAVSISAVRTYGLLWPVGSTYIICRGVPNENYGEFDGCADNAAALPVQLNTTGSVIFHHRYIGQVKK